MQRKEARTKKAAYYFRHRHRHRHRHRTFSDGDGTFTIIGIDRNTASSKGKGSQTLFYKFYNIVDHQSPPTNSDDYDRIPCVELHKDPDIVWTIDGVSPSRAYMTQSLNLNDDGSPLTLKSALGGMYKEAWQVAYDNEIRKLVTTTMYPIPKSMIPSDRRRYITYYNPVIKEKIKEVVL